MSNIPGTIESLFIDRVLRRDEQAVIWLFLPVGGHAPTPLLSCEYEVMTAIFADWVARDVSIDIISQSFVGRDGFCEDSGGGDDVSEDKALRGGVEFAVSLNEAQLDRAIMPFRDQVFSTVDYQYRENLSAITLVGSGMRSHQGVASKMFSALAEAEVPVYVISTSEIKICCIVDTTKAEIAVTTLKAIFSIQPASDRA